MAGHLCGTFKCLIGGDKALGWFHYWYILLLIWKFSLYENACALLALMQYRVVPTKICHAKIS